MARVKENFCHELHKDYMEFFLKKWFRRSEKDAKGIDNCYRSVVEEFISRSYGSTDTIVNSIIAILDETSFEEASADKIENILLQTNDDGGIGRQIIRSLAIFLLKYL